MTNSTDTVTSTREAIWAQKDQITQLLGGITPEAIDNMEEEVGGVVATVKSYHFKGGRDNGHLAVVVPESEYREVIGDDQWDYEVPEDQDEAYDPKQ